MSRPPASAALPHWDMTPIFPSLESTEFQDAFRATIKAIESLSQLFDDSRIAKQGPAPVNAKIVSTYERATTDLNNLFERLRTLSAYIMSFVTTDSRDDLAQAKLSELQEQSVRLSQLGTRFTAWIGSLEIEALIAASETAREHAFMLRRAKTESEHLMSPPEEELAAALRPSGSTAWSKLHGNYTSQIVVPIEVEGQPSTLPMSMVRNLANDPHRETRRRAYEAELAAWENAAVPLAAALNSIKGAANVISRRRNWPAALDAALFENNVDRATLDAMMTAARESFPFFRRYLRAKARALALPALTWYDLFAPLPGGSRTWSYDKAAYFIRSKFREYSPKMGALADRAFGEQWIDAEPRDGKRDGAFCMSVRADESRVLANFEPSFDSVSTLAHELGHAYHNVNLASRTMMQRQTPMALAETASIFCETLVTQEALKEAEPAEQLAILEQSLQGACQVVVDISSRFLFEQNVFERRHQRELSVEELNELMLESQRATYGDGLDPNVLHPYMWAVKQHYYQTNYYNYPYMFGLLFGLGLFAHYYRDPASFKAGYDELLSSTGLANAAELAARFGIDTRAPDFWRSSLEVIGMDAERFEQLVGA